MILLVTCVCVVCKRVSVCDLGIRNLAQRRTFHFHTIRHWRLTRSECPFWTKLEAKQQKVRTSRLVRHPHQIGARHCHVIFLPFIPTTSGCSSSAVVGAPVSLVRRAWERNGIVVGAMPRVTWTFGDTRARGATTAPRSGLFYSRSRAVMSDDVALLLSFCN